jgi:sulfite reductase (NADPH) flavoprotein alpha-component
MTTSTVPSPSSAGIPFVPDNAPFTPAQRAWLNGLLAGMFSGMQPGHTAAPPAAAPVKVKVPVFFGSESGNAEALSKRVAKAVQQRGFESKAIGLDKISVKDLAKEKFALIITSTFGEGDPPENAKAFHAELHTADHPGFANLNYSVLALGDKNYEQFCKCGIDFDKRLEALGARRLYERVDCDVDYEASYQRWQTGVLGVLEAAAKEVAPGPAPATAQPPPGTPGAPAIIGDNPVEAGHEPGPTTPGKTGPATEPGAPPAKAA